MLNPSVGINTKHGFSNIMVCIDNLSFLNNLAAALQQWVDFNGKNFTMFDEHVRGHLQRAYEAMKTRNKLL